MNYIFWIFTITVALAPMPFGLVYSVSQALFACIFFALATGYCTNRLITKNAPAVSLWRIWPECIGFALILVWIVFQMTPVSPEHWHHPLWAEASYALGRDLNGSISLARGAGIESLMRLSMYAAVFWTALQLGRSRFQAARFFIAITAAGTIYAAYGLIMHFSGIEAILWVDKTTHIGDLTGTFVNRNNFATYMGLCLLCATGLYLTGFFKTMQSRRIGRDKAIYVLQQSFMHGAPLLACIMIMLTALFLTHSRAGVIASVIALLVMVALLGALGRITTRFYKIFIVILIMVSISIFFLSGEGWLERVTATDLDKEVRLQTYEQTWRSIHHAPITGYGMGSFETTFPIFADEKTSSYRKAHNDWLETAFELGLPAAAVWFAVLVGLGFRCILGVFRRRRDHVYPVAGFCACILTGLHAMVDFSLQIPAVAITFCVIMGVGIGQGENTRSKP